MIPNPKIFTIVFVAAILLFVWSCVRRFGLVTVGKPEDRFENFPARIRDTFVYAFAQKRVLQKAFGLNHFILFWSFMVLLLANGEFVLKGLHRSITFMALPAAIHNPLYFLFDLVSLFALICVIVAGIRRIVAPPYPEAITADAYFILGMIAGLMIAYFNLHGVEIAAGEVTATMPISAAVGNMFYAGITPEAAHPYITFWWWLHALIFLVFLNYLPYSKHMHILSSIPNCYFRRFEKANTLPVETFVKGNKFGVETIDQYTWKDLFDSYSCTECGRCQMVCPASQTGKPLNPRQVIHDLKINLLTNGPIMKKGGKPVLPLIGENGEGSITEDQIWSCTSCGACMEVCPVFIEQMPKILQLRRYLVEMKAQFPEELLNLFENMEQRSNPWGIAPTERTKWCAQLNVKTFDDSCEYLLYVGCAGAFDARNKQVTVALAHILDAAGISWGILGKEEMCCGDSLRRLGNEFIFDRMAKDNVKLWKEKGVKKIITMCPHCFSTLQNDYRQYGFEGEVIHHADFIDNLLKSGKLKLKKTVDLGRVVFHDSCYLGRHNDIYDSPRAVLSKATGKAPTEMERNRDQSFCCGAGGGRMWMEEHLGTRINLARVDEALTKNPDTVCVTCPYCMTMFDDGLKDKNADKVVVKDIAEVVAEGLR
ncbi:MAG TPA: (Fe-S)-binding protein [Deltaproteobacteria bacterium]|nr:(Fe-S)-binding protein [Deltaproteobacteria bacterium]HNQ86101.1 (Fe-S)-binding protein [Deltaproteobacteria bacterium]HNS89276.1 (Fe-S)-binding protein [Deltaproteobacteria bacterium]HOA44519.1 (Fe-S)-binding protein [Deltaproteobacteria bacterium]HOC76879.1 (Fe-S)-binding protein [Deltaproteobacteria bacterium]